MKLTALLLNLLMILTLTGCGAKPAESEAPSVSESTPQTEQTPQTPDDTSSEGSSETESAPESAQQGVTAVVYFSATGTTQRVALEIAQQCGADVFEITPQEEYTADDLDYGNDSCRANVEMNDPDARPAISGDLSAVSGYDTVILGYPIWWGTAPRIVQTFMDSCDLGGAEVYTFCTSGSSGVERSLSDLREYYPEVNIVSGKRFGSGASAQDISAWLSEAGIAQQ